MFSKFADMKINIPKMILLCTVTTAVVLTVIAQCQGTEKLENTPPHASAFSDLLDVKGGTGNVKDYEGFRVSFNPGRGTSDWVAWELLGSETEGNVPRASRFWTDESLEGCPQTEDYTRSGYDRGHLCPAADQKWSEQAMTDCFSLANIAPQAHALNSGAWKTLENKEREWARRDSALVIVAGPLYGTEDKIRIGKTGVLVPGAFFKVIIAPYLPEPRGIGFIYPNLTAPGNMRQYSMSIDEVEALTGLDFFHNLPDDIENKIESTTSFAQWNTRAQ